MSTPLPKGFFIVVDGIDGAGKTTLVEGLRAYYSSKGVPVVVSKEPTQGPFGQELRNRASLGRLTLPAELTMFTRDRAQHVQEVIEPALSAGDMVILDRYFPSTAAYQGAEGADPQMIIQDQCSLFPVPDLILILDLPVEMGRARISSRGDLPNHYESTETLERARKIFQNLPIGTKEEKRVVVLDARCTIEEVLQAAKQSVINRVAAAYFSEQPELAIALTERFLGGKPG